MLIRRRWGRTELNPSGVILIIVGSAMMLLITAYIWLLPLVTWDKVILETCSMTEFIELVNRIDTIDSDKLNLQWVYVSGPPGVRGRKGVSSEDYGALYALLPDDDATAINVLFFTVHRPLTPRQQSILVQSGKVADIRRYRPFPYSWSFNWSILHKD